MSHSHQSDESGKTAFQHSVDLSIDFIAGANGAVAGVYVGQPLDTVKVKMQTFPAVYGNAVRCFMQTLRKDGVARGLYAGTVPALAANVAENSILFAAYGACQKSVASLLGTSVERMRPTHNALAGSMAAVFSSLALCPTELVKCRLQALREQLEAGKAPKGVDIATVPGYFFFFGGYELSRAAMTPKGGNKDKIGPVKTALAGGIGGVALWTAIFPFDVLKSRMQIASEGQVASMRALFMEILRKEGVTALYAGLSPTIVRTFFASGALFVAYEWTKKVMHAAAGF
uniref:Mitochondrial ornithine transporter 1 n=1 Tax=Macrostomum lignano TaxID=282301 RepID=A0A1I8IDE7_9PLAT